MTMLSNELVENIYDAALDSTHWQAVLNSVADYYDASVCVLMCHNHDFPQNDVHVHVHNPEEIQQLYMQEYFLDGDLWYQIARRNWQRESVIIGEEHISDEQLCRTAFYNDILKPADAGQQLSGSIAASGASTKAVAISRPLSSKRFCQSDKHSMSELVGHLRRAFDIHEKLTLGESQNSLLQRLLAMTNTAAIVCTSDATPVFHNSLAETFLREADGLLVSQGSLVCKRRTNTEEMHAVFKKLRTLGSFMMNIEGLNGPNSYNLMMFPIDSARHAMDQDRDLVGIFVHRPGDTRVPDTSALRELFNLTVAEAVIAGFIYSGLTPAQIAQKKQVTVSTVRTQLHRIFEKTGTRNQAQLVRVMAETQIWQG